MRLPVWLRFTLIFSFAGFCGGILVLAASYLYLAPQLPPAGQIREVAYQIPLRIYTADHKLMAEYGEQRRQPIAADAIPDTFKAAILAAEDERFYQHKGVDPKGLIRAASELARYRDIRSGGSTITMQVARNFFLGREQRFLRKFNEIVLAIQIERVLSKDEILQLYLNKIYLGHRAYGVEAAAQVYYGQSIGELTLPQMAMIAGLPKAPSAYNPITNPERARIRRNWILQRMEDTGYLSTEQRQQAQQAVVSARFHAPSPEVEASYAAEMARLQAAALVDAELYTDGIRIITTLDSNAQMASVTALRAGLHDYDERHGYRGHLGRVDSADLPPLDPVTGTIELSPDSDQEQVVDSQQPSTRDLEDTILGLPGDVAAWASTIRRQRRIGPLEPVVVTEVREQDADILFRDGNRSTLQWADIRWAREQLRNRALGPVLQQAADRLSRGDVIYVRPVGKDSDRRWRLAQLPDVQAALVSLDPGNGAIRAIQGGYSFAESNFNRAAQGERQTGSVFKPFVYTAALENGFTPASIVNDAPMVFDDAKLETSWRPTGSSGKFYGPTRIREALYRSLNLVSIRLLRQIGISQTMETVARFGLPIEKFERDLSLALGSGSSTPLTVAAAYSVFANGGYQVKPWLIERIENLEGEVLWQAPRVELCDAACDLAISSIDDDSGFLPPVQAPRVLDQRIAWLMDSMMKDVINQGTGTAAKALGRNDLAGKTGTTNELNDAWFSGYSPDLVATVWVGFDNPASLGRGEYGGRAALPIWIDYMRQALNGVAENILPQPEDITAVRIDPTSGLLARPENRNAVLEYFIKDQEPAMEAPRGEDGQQSSPEQIF